MRNNRFKSFKSKVALLLAMVLMIMSVPVYVSAEDMPANALTVTATADKTTFAMGEDSGYLYAAVDLNGVAGTATGAAIYTQWYLIYPNSDDQTAHINGPAEVVLAEGAEYSGLASDKFNGGRPNNAVPGVYDHYVVLLQGTVINPNASDRDFSGCVEIGRSNTIRVTVTEADKTALIAAIAAAKTESTTKVSADGKDVLTDAFWVYQSEMTDLENAITAAEKVKDEVRTTAAQAATAVTNLTGAVDTFKGLKKPGLSALVAAIADAKSVLSDASVSTTNGSDLEATQKWVTQDDVDALNTAIGNADTALGNVTTVDEINAAIDALNTAVADFKAAIKPGTKPATVEFTGLTANGDTDTTTTELTLEFDKNPVGLAVGNLTVTGSALGSVGTLTENSGTYTLGITLKDTAVEGDKIGVAVADFGAITFTNAAHEVAIHVAPVVKTSLETAIANAKTEIATATESADGTDVATDAYWVTSAVKTALNTAISDAEAKLATVKTTAEAEAAAKDLDAAVAVFTAAKAKGTKTDDQTDPGLVLTSLETAIASAKTELATATESADGTDVATDAFWVTAAVKAALNTAISDAEAKLKTVTTTAEAEAAAEILDKAVAAFTAAKAKGTKTGDQPEPVLDFTALDLAIENAEKELGAVEISVDGSDVDPSLFWVTQEVYDAFEANVARAYETYAIATSQKLIGDVVSLLNILTEDFKTAQAPGTMVDPAVVEDKIENIIADAGTKEPEDILAAVEGMEAELTAALISAGKEDSIIATLKSLEDTYASRISAPLTDPEVGADIPGGFKSKESLVKVVGAGFSAKGKGEPVQLHFLATAPEAQKQLDPKEYNTNTAVQVDITITGANDAENLSAPIFITVPIPETIKDDGTFIILHYRSNGKVDTIKPTPNGDGSCSFAVDGFSTFIFVNNVPVPVPVTPPSSGGSVSTPSDTGSKEITYYYSAASAPVPPVVYDVSVNKNDGEPLVASVIVPVNAGATGNATLNVTASMVQKAISEARAKMRGLSAEEKKDGAVIEIAAESGADIKGIFVRIDKSVLQRIAATDFSLLVYSDVAFVELDNDAVSDILESSNSAIRFSARPVAAGSRSALKISGGRPAYTVFFKNARNKDISEPENGTVTFGLHYEASRGEDTDNLGVMEIKNNKGAFIEESFHEEGWVQWVGNANGVFSSAQNESAPPSEN